MTVIPSQLSSPPVTGHSQGSIPGPDENYELQSNEIQRRYQSTGDSLCLHQLGNLALSAGKLVQARMYFLSERKHIQPGEHGRLAANAYEMGRMAQLRGEPCQAMLYVRASLRYARLAQTSFHEQRARQLLTQLMLLLGERPRDVELMSQSA